MSFDALGLTPELLRAVADQGYTEPTPVQREAIPLVLAGRDLLAGAQTGTGKTAAFVLPMLQLLNADANARLAARRRRPATTRATVAAPPVADPRPRPHPDPRARAPGRGERPDLRRPPPDPLDRDLRRRRLRAPGPRPARRARDRRRDARPPARPRRAAHHRPLAGSRSSSSTRPTGCSTWASSATSARSSRCSRRPPEPAVLARPSRTTSAQLAGGSCTTRRPSRSRRATRPPSSSRRSSIPVDRERKRELLTHLIRSGRIEQALVFTRTKHGANRLAEQLGRDGIDAAAIHGNKSQGQRVRALDDFKAGRATILVATEIAARGLDIEALPHVVNYELPMVPEDYVHRIGRTGRAGVDGDAISLVCVDEAPLLRDIERLLGRPIPTRVIPGFEPGPLDPPGADPPAVGRPALRESVARQSVRGRSRPPAWRCSCPSRPRPGRDTNAGPFRHASASGPDRSQGPRRDGPRPGAPGSDINRGGGIPGPRRRSNDGGPRPGQSGPRHPARGRHRQRPRPAPGWAGGGERMDRNGDPRGRSDRPRDDRGRNPGPTHEAKAGRRVQNLGGFRAIPGERLARASAATDPRATERDAIAASAMLRACGTRQRPS